jgi:hypothetical protein
MVVGLAHRQHEDYHSRKFDLGVNRHTLEALLSCSIGVKEAA